MTERLSPRALAREIYGALAQGQAGDVAKQAASVASSEAAPTPDPSPQGGGEKEAAPSLCLDQQDLTAQARALYEGGTVPVSEIARLCGVSERTIYKYAARENWPPRYRWKPHAFRTPRAGDDAACAGADQDARPALQRGQGWLASSGLAPVKGAGGRFIARADKDKPFARGLKALDAEGRARAQAACDKAAQRAAAAATEAARNRRLERRIRAIDAVNGAMAAYLRFRDARALAAERAHKHAVQAARQASRASFGRDRSYGYGAEPPKERVTPQRAASAAEPARDPAQDLALEALHVAHLERAVALMSTIADEREPPA